MVNKKKYITLSLILLVFVIATGFVLFNLNNQKSNSTPKTTQNSSTNKIIAALDKPFYIDLVSNPSTGYQWQADFDTSLVKLNKTSYSQPNETNNVVGSEVTQSFEFQPLQKTDMTITFRYVRPWETDTPPSKTATYSITIQ